MKKSTIYIALGTLLIFSCFYICSWVFYSPWALVLNLFTMNIGSYLVKKGRQLYNIETGKPHNLYLLTGNTRRIISITANALMVIMIVLAFGFRYWS